MSIPSLCQVVTCAVLVHLTVLVSSTYFTILGIEGIRADKYFISQQEDNNEDDDEEEDIFKIIWKRYRTQMMFRKTI